MSNRSAKVIQGFNTQPPEGGWLRIGLLRRKPTCFNTQPPEGGWLYVLLPFCRSYSFNTQPPEGGWSQSLTRRSMFFLFQHTAARRRLVVQFQKCSSHLKCFNTQPPEGGWRPHSPSSFTFATFQHTAARRRLEPLSKALLHQVSQPRFR